MTVDGDGVVATLGPGGKLIPTWYDVEEEYLNQVRESCLELSVFLLEVHRKTFKIQTRLRLPAIVLSSLSGVTSFGTSVFPQGTQKWVNVGVGLINVSIAIIQTYESYLKISDTVTKSLACAQALKKLADYIYCELFIPMEDRDQNGITMLRDCFTRYQAILDQGPSVVFANETLMQRSNRLVQDISQQFLNSGMQPPFRSSSVHGNSGGGDGGGGGGGGGEAEKKIDPKVSLLKHSVPELLRTPSVRRSTKPIDEEKGEAGPSSKYYP